LDENRIIVSNKIFKDGAFMDDRCDNRGYFEEINRKSRNNPSYQNTIESFLKQVDAVMAKKGTVSNPESAEKVLTDILHREELLQEILLGVHFSDRTEIRTQNREFLHAFAINER